MKKIVVVFSFMFLYHFSFAQIEQVKGFLPEVFSQFPNVRDIAFAPDGNEVYFTIQSHLEGVSVIGFIKRVGGKWSAVQVASFSGKANDLEPFFNSDGLRLYFVSNRSLDAGSSVVKDYDIWYVERKNLNGEWSLPINVGSPVNSSSNEFYPSLSKNGNLYFTSDALTTKGKDDIFICEYKHGKYLAPVSLSDSINTPGYEFNAFVSSDESYILFTAYNREGGFGSGDLYISYKNRNGGWSKAMNLGKEINSDKMDYCPYVDASNVLYFTSKRNNVKSVFDKNLNLVELQKEMNKYENGLSRIYSFDAKAILKK